MTKKWRPTRKLPSDRLAPLPWWNGRSLYRAPLTMAVIDWSRLRELFRRGRPAERAELPRAAQRRRKI
jgi:hypothetical protein